MQYPNQVGLMIAVPLTGRPLVPEFTWAFANLHPPMNYNVRHLTIRNHPVDEARNLAAEESLKQNCKYLFFIDEDVTPPAHTVRQLIFHMEHQPQAAVIGGIYCHKAEPPMPMVFRGNGAGPYWDWKAGELFEVSGIGMGCTMIRTEVFKSLEKPYFKTVDDMSAFLKGVNSAEQWTEDLYFLDKVIKAGWKVFADGGILPQHWNMFTGKPTVLPANSLPLRSRLITSDKPIKKIVDLGCGESPYQTDEGDVTTVDIRDDVKPDYRSDLRYLPFGEEEFDIVYSSHCLEHFSREDVEIALDEWVRILKKDGELRLCIPNIEWAADQIKKGIVDNDVLNVLYGAQDFRENFHMMGFTPKSLEMALKKRGFNYMEVSLQGYNIVMQAWRRPKAKKNGKENGKESKTKSHRSVSKNGKRQLQLVGSSKPVSHKSRSKKHQMA